MKCLIVQDCCPFHLALHAKHSCQVSTQLSNGASLCCHWLLPMLATLTGPWPHSPNPNYTEPWNPAKKWNRLGFYSSWSFSQRKKKTALMVAAWGAIEHVKTLRPEQLGMWWSEGREEDTSNTTSNNCQKDERWEKKPTGRNRHSRKKRVKTGWAEVSSPRASSRHYKVGF